MYFIINNKDRIKVDKYRSGYYLKYYISQKYNYDIDTFLLLTPSSKLIKDDRLLECQFPDCDVVNVNVKIISKGGKSTTTMFFILCVIIYFLLFFFAINTGIFNMVAYLYAFLFEKGIYTALNFIQTNFGHLGFVACLLYPLIILTKILDFVISHFVVFLFLFIGLTLVTLPILSGLKFSDLCKSIFYSKKIAYICVIAYFIIYLLLNLPNLFLQSLILLSSVSELLQTITSPFITFTQNMINKGKYIGLYMIPFYGQALILLHDIIYTVIYNLKDTTRDFKSLNCYNQYSIKQVVDTLQNISDAVNNKKGPGINIGKQQAFEDIIQFIKNNNMGKMVDYAIMGLDDKQFKIIEQEYKQSSFIKKIDFLGISTIGRKYFVSIAAKNILCAVFDSIAETDAFIDSISPNIENVIDKIKSGIVAANGTSIVYVITFIITLIYPSFIG